MGPIWGRQELCFLGRLSSSLWYMSGVDIRCYSGTYSKIHKTKMINNWTWKKQQYQRGETFILHNRMNHKEMAKFISYLITITYSCTGHTTWIVEVSNYMISCYTILIYHYIPLANVGARDGTITNLTFMSNPIITIIVCILVVCSW